MSEELLEVKGLSKSFGSLHAVREVDLHLRPSETLGLVGESGCGKSTLARLLVRLLTPDQGEIRFEGENLLGLRGSALKKRRRKFQMIFQDPYASLNPRMSVYQTLSEPLVIHGLAKRGALEERVVALLGSVGLRPEMMRRYPHEFSGGQRQRIGIARALAVEPRLIVADEPVSALDVSVQAQILNLLMDLQEQKHLSYLLITHDLRVVERLSDRIAVMYLGRIVEEGPADRITKQPLHPYTQALLRSVPNLPSERSGQTPKRLVLQGEIASPRNPPPGCAFHPRCPIAVDRCRTERPLLEAKSPEHRVACHLA